MWIARGYLRGIVIVGSQKYGEGASHFTGYICRLPYLQIAAGGSSSLLSSQYSGILQYNISLCDIGSSGCNG